MGRPPLPLGTHGRIRVYRLGPRRFRARTQVRDHDGVIRDVERTGPSTAAAENLLRIALRDRDRAVRDGEVTGETTVCALGELWLGEMDRLVQQGKRSPPPPRHTATGSTGTSATVSAGCGCGSCRCRAWIGW